MSRKERRSQSRAQSARAHNPKSPNTQSAPFAAYPDSTPTPRRHPAFAQTILLETESADQLDRLVNQYIADYQPQNESQLKIVYRMASATWRHQRAQTIEAVLVNEKMHQQHPDLEKLYPEPNIPAALRTTFAFSGLSLPDSPLKAFQNAADLCERQFGRALRDLDRAKKMNTGPKAAHIPEPPPVPDPAPEPEPSPEPEPEPTGEPVNRPVPAPTQPAAATAPPTEERQAILRRVDEILEGIANRKPKIE